MQIIEVLSPLQRKNYVGTAVIRHLALRNGHLLVTVGKHTEFTYDRATGKVISIKSD